MAPVTHPTHYQIELAAQYHASIEGGNIPVVRSSRSTSINHFFGFHNPNLATQSMQDALDRALLMGSIETKLDRAIQDRVKQRARYFATILPSYLVPSIEFENIYPTGHGTVGILIEQKGFGDIGIDIGANGIGYFVNLDSRISWVVRPEEFSPKQLIDEISGLLLKTLAKSRQ